MKNNDATSTVIILHLDRHFSRSTDRVILPNFFTFFFFQPTCNIIFVDRLDTASHFDTDESIFHVQLNRQPIFTKQQNIERRRLAKRQGPYIGSVGKMLEVANKNSRGGKIDLSHTIRGANYFAFGALSPQPPFTLRPCNKMT